MDKNKLKEFFYSKTKEEQIDLIVNGAKCLKAAHIKRQKAIDSYVNHKDVNRGPRGGRHATLCGKMDQATDQYLQRIEYLRELVSFLD